MCNWIVNVFAKVVFEKTCGENFETDLIFFKTPIITTTEATLKSHPIVCVLSAELINNESS